MQGEGSTERSEERIETSGSPDFREKRLCFDRRGPTYSSISEVGHASSASIGR